MKILITGATGFIGRQLCARLLADGHELTLVLRRAASLPSDWGIPADTIIWDPSQAECPEPLDAYDAVVNLMGESVAQSRWTATQKERIRSSRGLATQRLATALKKRQKTLPVFISASAIGYYPYDASEGLTEDARQGQHFLASVCQEWEAAALAAPAQRHVIFRIGVVLGPNGGAMGQLRPLFAAGLGGRLGDGAQMMSWIHRDDLVTMIAEAVSDDSWRGIYNAVSPEAVSNRRFTAVLGRSLHRPALLPVPATALRLVLGERSELLLRGQNIQPAHLIREDFVFRFPSLQAALDDIALPRLETHQFLPYPLAEVFRFFCDPHNLERLTPGRLNFRIESMSTPEIQTGTIIRYRLRLRGVPFRWQTLIKDWQPNVCFTDIQQKGPYAVWEHTHRFQSVAGGTLMSDTVRYQVPLGWLGESVALRLVQSEVKNIFLFRRQAIAGIFSAKKMEATG